MDRNVKRDEVETHEKKHGVQTEIHGVQTERDKIKCNKTSNMFKSWVLNRAAFCPFRNIKRESLMLGDLRIIRV